MSQGKIRVRVQILTEDEARKEKPDDLKPPQVL